MCVYMIRAGDSGPIKIGYALNIRQRISRMQADNHELLNLIALIPADKRNEAELHEALVADRIRGEWFRPSKAVLALAAAMPHQESRRLNVSRLDSPIRRIATRFGGVAAMAAAIGFPPEDDHGRRIVSGWIRIRSIPGWYFADILAAAERHGIPVTAEELAEIARDRSRQRAAA